MKRRPTRRAFVVVGIGALLILAGATAQAGWLFVLAAGVLGLAAGSLLVRHRLGGIEVTRKMPYRTRVGDQIRTGLSIRNTSSGSAPLLIITDHFPAFPPSAIGIESLGGGQRAEIEMVSTATRRGVFKGSDVVLETGAPFGLTRTRRRAKSEGELIVVPSWVELASFPLVQPNLSPSDVSHQHPRAGAGDEFLGVRSYRPGDPLRAVHWRSTARTGSLVVREFEQEIASRVALVIAGSGDAELEPAFEMLVSAAASIGLHALAMGHPIDLVSSDGKNIDHLTDPSRNALLDHLAAVQPGETSLEAMVESALGWIGRRGTVVVCTTDQGETGDAIPGALSRVERAGGNPVLVVARSSTWVGESAAAFEVPPAVPIRELHAGRGLSECLA